MRLAQQHQANLGHRFKEIKKEEARLRKERHHVLLQLEGGDDDCHAYGIISGGGRRRSSSRLQSIGSGACWTSIYGLTAQCIVYNIDEPIGRYD